jgi:tartrate dehydratase beta subunit/fumarate hydratase class I family protein
MKNKLNISALALFLVVSASASSAYAENDKGKHQGWIKPGNTVKYIEANDAGKNVDINKNGEVVLRGGVVTSISGNMIVVSTTLGSSVLTWTGNFDSSTKLESKNGKAIDLSQITVGDTVTIKGTMNSGSALSIKVSLIRDVSKAVTPVVINTKQVFEGKLTATSGNTTPTTITMMIGSTPQVVNLSSITILLNKAWGVMSLSNFQIGDTVRVFGFVPTGTTSVTALVLRNASR